MTEAEYILVSNLRSARVAAHIMGDVLLTLDRENALRRVTVCRALADMCDSFHKQIEAAGGLDCE